MTPVQADGRERPTLAEIRAWPATVSVPKAGTAWGMSRNQSYNMAKRGEFPATVNRIGNRYTVVTASIIRALSGDVDTAGQRDSVLS
ncbi:DNA-binding protein [Amycolatopsis rhizosphaerae]|uniref:DNA-binding protein n=1 Tax=Amycolatopsis rhizosphaerae TaxID=2053003 RepID=A0A558DLU6_9PSEU|nr:DNA-binding protein [Amycolatopsis rhizosphaerae]TVT61982.1 DNA-binding protein [Amycolatopsis rhizosphaerae]